MSNFINPVEVILEGRFGVLNWSEQPLRLVYSAKLFRYREKRRKTLNGCCVIRLKNSDTSTANVGRLYIVVVAHKAINWHLCVENLPSAEANIGERDAFLLPSASRRLLPTRRQTADEFSGVNGFFSHYETQPKRWGFISRIFDDMVDN